MTIITGKNIDIFQLRTLRKAVELEEKGLKRSGRSATAVAKQRFGLSRGAKREKVYEAIDKAILELQ